MKLLCPPAPRLQPFRPLSYGTARIASSLSRRGYRGSRSIWPFRRPARPAGLVVFITTTQMWRNYVNKIVCTLITASFLAAGIAAAQSSNNSNSKGSKAHEITDSQMSNVTAGQTDTSIAVAGSTVTTTNSASATLAGSSLSDASGVNIVSATNSSCRQRCQHLCRHANCRPRQRRFAGQPDQHGRPVRSGFDCHAVEIQQRPGSNREQHLRQHGKHNEREHD